MNYLALQFFLSTLDLSKSTGLDGIGPRLLKISSSVITKINVKKYYIAQACILKSYFPDNWKHAKVNHLYKGGAKEEVNTYCPIFIITHNIKIALEIYSKELF